jgi:hypothetical protein
VEDIVFQIGFEWIFDGSMMESGAEGGAEGGVEGEVKMREGR